MRLPVHRRPLPWRDPETVVVALATRGDVIWTDAGHGASSGRSVVAWGPALTATGPAELSLAWAELRDGLADVRHDADPLGPAGWLGYGTGTWLLDRDATVGAGRGAPPSVTEGLSVDLDGPADLALLRTDRALVFDHADRTVEAVVLGDDDWLSEVEAAWHAVPEHADDVGGARPGRRGGPGTSTTTRTTSPSSSGARTPSRRETPTSCA